MARRILVVTTATAPKAEVESIVRAHAGEDAEIHVIAPASKISWLDRLINAEDDARIDAAERADAASEAVDQKSEAHVGDVDPVTNAAAWMRFARTSSRWQGSRTASDPRLRRSPPQVRTGRPHERRS